MPHPGFILEFSWLKKWKLRADTEDGRKVDGGKQEDIANGMCWRRRVVTEHLSQARLFFQFWRLAKNFLCWKKSWKSAMFPPSQTRGTVGTSRVKPGPMTSRCVTPC